MITDKNFSPFILATGNSIVHLAMFTSGIIVVTIYDQDGYAMIDTTVERLEKSKKINDAF